MHSSSLHVDRSIFRGVFRLGQLFMVLGWDGSLVALSWLRGISNDGAVDDAMCAPTATLYIHDQEAKAQRNVQARA